MPRLKINRRLEPLLVKPKPIKVIVGGRGSGKSIGVGDIMTMKMETEAADIYCLREFQESVIDSVHRVFVDSIEQRLKLRGWQVFENKVIAPTGARTVYRGAARNPDSIQSAQGYKYSWFEEAHRASKTSLDKLLPTILRNPGSECWFTANPQSSADAFSQRFLAPYLDELNTKGYYEDDLHLILKVNWRDNPWWNAEQEALRVWDYENRPRAEYDWIWEGSFNDSVEGSIIKPEWFDAAIDAHRLDKRAEGLFEPHGPVIVAHDPFDDGEDAGGLAVRHGSIIQHVSAKKSGAIDEVCDWATGEARKRSADWFVWDGDGMGTGLKRQVATAFDGTRTQYHMFRGSLSGRAQDNALAIYEPQAGDKTAKTYADTFKNNRAQYYVALANRFKATYNFVVRGKHSDPAEMISLNSEGIDDIVGLRSEMCRIPRKPDGNGLEQIMSKQDMKKAGIRSPNMSDAVMMSMFTPPTEGEFKQIDFDGWR
jgi:phage terminase large subunit